MALQAVLGLPSNPTFRFCNEKTDDEALEEAAHWHQTQLPLAPKSFLALRGDYTDTANGKRIQINLDKGTTTLAFKFQGGIVVAADSRATGGEFIGSYTVRKVVEINEYLLGTLAGCAADCIYWYRVLAQRCRMHELRNRERISVAAASKLLANMLYNYKGMDLSVGAMIAGYDQKGPGLFYVDNEGNRLPGSVFGAGSGSPYAFGVFDQGYDWNMSEDDACELARKAIYHATFRDSFSGGNIRVYHVKDKGWKRVSVDDCNDLHYKYQDEKMV